jgi:hypothetical protein
MAVSEDYGTRMGRAVQAVHQMHVDVTKMITLLEKAGSRARPSEDHGPGEILGQC